MATTPTLSPPSPSSPPGSPTSRTAGFPTWLRVPRQPLLRHVPVAVLGGVVLYFVTQSFSPYNNYLVGQIASYVVVLCGLSLLTGANGQFSLGHGGFMAVGAYTEGLFMMHTGTNFLLELAASAGVAAVAGIVIGLPATRLKGPYLAGMTLLFALALPPIADKWPNTFGGDQGLTVAPPAAPGTLAPQEWLAWIQIICALVVMILIANLMRSRYGRAFRAVRDDEIAASLAGIPVARTKVMAFAVSAACAGLGGALLALSTGVVNTGAYPLTLSIQLLAAMVLGGTGTLVGMVWGGILLVYMPQWSSSLSDDFHLANNVSPYLATIIFGVVLIVGMMAAPEGIQGGFRWIWRKISPPLFERGGSGAGITPASAVD